MFNNTKEEKFESKVKDVYASPIFGSIESDESMPRKKLHTDPMDPKIAYRLIKDELLNEGNARLNLATFCQTYMEDEAVQIMAETFDKNAIDKSEYPQTAAIEQRCVDIIADLWNVDKSENYLGTSTVGSSEACMLGGMAMKFSWRKRAKELGVDITKQRPNLIITSGYQVCWEKLCVYLDIELRAVPMTKENMAIDPEKVLDYVDDYTIGIVGLLGITYTGKYDDIVALDKLCEDFNNTHDQKLYLHIDGASGAMFSPFVNPELLWDFRLKNVVSISTSGHKYGLVYPGIGWVIWRDRKFLPEELIFEVSYLGGHMPTMAINFSRSASQIIGQYYAFVRYGFEGFKRIHERTRDVALYLSSEIEKMGIFEIFNDGNNLPIVCYTLKEDANVTWTLYDLANKLLMKGWQVPAYPLPANLDNVIIQRIVCRADLGKNLADTFLDDFTQAVKDLNYNKDNKGCFGFTH
ncbi:MAG: glutamate decarboxylase [Sarcina sp.]